MRNKTEKIQNAVFIITQERSCPLYTAGEEIKVANFGISISSYKPVCLYLAQKTMGIVSNTKSLGAAISPMRSQRGKFDCGGCGGLIHFEYKQEKEFATLQMKLLKETEEKRRKQHLERYFGMLRGLPIFKSLEDDALKDLTVLLDFKTIPIDKVVIKKEEPCNYLFIILDGQVGVIGEDGTRILELGAGDILGETSFLTGDPVANSVHTLAPTQLAMLSTKNFKNVIVGYPVLQIFLFKMLVDWAQTMTLRSGNITSGMNGKLAEIPAVDLFQLINSSQKTGTVELSLDAGRAAVYFQDGQIVRATYRNLADRDAVFALLREKNGLFTYTRGIPDKLNNTPPIGDFMGMLMEGLQRIDEA